MQCTGGPEVPLAAAAGVSPLDEATSRSLPPASVLSVVEDPTAPLPEEVKELQAQLQRGVGRSVEALSTVFLGKELGPPSAGEAPPPQKQQLQQSSLVAELLQAVMSNHSIQMNQMGPAGSSSGLRGGSGMDALAVSSPQGEINLSRITQYCLPPFVRLHVALPKPISHHKCTKAFHHMDTHPLVALVLD